MKIGCFFSLLCISFLLLPSDSSGDPRGGRAARLARRNAAKVVGPPSRKTSRQEDGKRKPTEEVSLVKLSERVDKIADSLEMLCKEVDGASRKAVDALHQIVITNQRVFSLGQQVTELAESSQRHLDGTVYALGSHRQKILQIQRRVQLLESCRALGSPSSLDLLSVLSSSDSSDSSDDDGN